MIPSKFVEAIRLAYLGRLGSEFDPDRERKRELTNKIVSTASRGHNQFLYKIDTPLSQAMIIYFQRLGYKIEPYGLQYKVSW